MLELPAETAILAHPVHLDLRVRLVLLALAHQALLDLQDPPVNQAKMAHQDYQVDQAQLDHKDRLVLLENRAARVLQVLLVAQDLKVNL